MDQQALLYPQPLAVRDDQAAVDALPFCKSIFKLFQQKPGSSLPVVFLLQVTQVGTSQGLQLSLFSHDQSPFLFQKLLFFYHLAPLRDEGLPVAGCPILFLFKFQRQLRNCTPIFRHHDMVLGLEVPLESSCPTAVCFSLLLYFFLGLPRPNPT